ncbi:hypothetical protein VT03_01315 [Planctomyces sp. SH-PL14]|nr:hypothetical protein VT03_01315 [Planctomyces sp. SH-PL14]
MEGQEGASTRELLAKSAELRHKSEVLRECLRDGESEAQNLRAYVLWWRHRQRAMFVGVKEPKPERDGNPPAQCQQEEPNDGSA